MITDSIRHILHSCRSVLSAVLVALIVLAGCRDSVDAPDDAPTKGVVAVDKSNVSLELTIGINNGGIPSTRAFTDQDGSFEGYAYPAEIVHTLRVVIVRHGVKQEDGSTADIVEHNRMVNVNSEYAQNGGNLITSYYVLHDNLRFNLIGGETKTIYLFANEGPVSEKQEFDFTNELKVGNVFPKSKVEGLLAERYAGRPYINNITYPNADGTVTQTQNVPMSESFEIKVPAPRGYGEDLYTQTLFMTRSLIKFSFSIDFDRGDLLDDDWAAIQNVGMKLAGVRITNLANASYYLPKGTTYNPRKYWPEPEGTNYFDLEPKPEGFTPTPQSIKNEERTITAFDVPGTPGSSDYASSCTFMFKEPIKITKAGTAEVSHVAPEIYLPESKLPADGSYMVSLIFDDEEFNDMYGSTALGILKGTEFEKLTDIPRNTHVKVNMTINLKKRDLSATVTLFPYTAVTLNPEFGFMVPVEEVVLSEEDITVEVGSNHTLNGWVIPDDATDKNIDWKSQNEKVATVNYYGLVEAVSLGETTVRALATDGTGNYKDCKVTVIPTKNLSIETGTEFSITGWLSTAEATDKTLQWASNDESIATVTPFGLVTAKNVGTAILSATGADGTVYECKVTVVSKVLVTSIVLSPGTVTIEVGGSTYINYEVAPQNATNSFLEWTSSSPVVATAHYSGYVSALSMGKTEIMASATDGSNKMSNTCVVTVVPLSTLSLEWGNSFSITGWQSAGDATIKNWTSNNTKVANVTPWGEVLASRVGKATITGGGYTCQVTVNPMAEITIQKNKTFNIAGNTTQDVATTVEWASSNTAVATVNSNGLVTAKAKGQTTITDPSGTYKSCRVFVYE